MIGECADGLRRRELAGEVCEAQFGARGVALRGKTERSATLASQRQLWAIKCAKLARPPHFWYLADDMLRIFPYWFSLSKLRPYRVVRGQKCIFIHINKTGGSSIIKTMRPKLKWHDTVQEVIEMIGREAYAQTFSFTVVRNPWAKVVSQYQYRIRSGQNQMRERPIAFADWVRKAYVERDAFYCDDPKMFMPQADWLKDANGMLLIDKVIRYEQLQEEFEGLKQQLGIWRKLPHRNATQKVDYRSFYDAETEAIIGEHFAEDIELWYGK